MLENTECQIRASPKGVDSAASWRDGTPTATRTQGTLLCASVRERCHRCRENTSRRWSSFRGRRAGSSPSE
eukprot:3438950-Pyramimonas_sp.AAC.1